MPLTRLAYKDYRGKLIVESIETMLERAKNDPVFPYPYPILAAMVESEIEDSGSRYQAGGPLSVTQLLSACRRCAVLQRHLDYTESIESIWGRWLGSMYHMLLENHTTPGDITEVRFVAKVPGSLELLTGKPDIIRPGVIIDLKTRKEVPTWDRPFDDHVMQLNFYRWLVNHSHRAEKNGEQLHHLDLMVLREMKFERLVLWYVDANKVKPLEVRKKIEVATKPGAQNPTKNIKVPDVWPDPYVEAIMVPRYEALREAFDAYEKDGRLPPYPQGQDPMPQNWWIHRFSPVAHDCLKSYFEGN